MNIVSPIKISYKNLVAAKLRSFLTILGIIIGIASVIVVMAIGGSAQKLILNQVSGVGSNLIGVLPGASDDKGPPASAMGIVVTTLKYADLVALKEKRNVPSVVDAVAYVSGSATVKNKSGSYQTSYQGVTASLLNVEDIKLKSGRFFLKDEDTNLAHVAVLGSNRVHDLFPNEDPIGKIITLKDVNLTVVGVLAERGSVGFSNTDDMIYVPLFTGQKLLLGIDYINFMRIKIDAKDNLDRAVIDVKKTLREQHRIKADASDDFSVRNSAQAIETLTTVTNVLKYFLTAVAAISLIVGGVGIMNIMLISVHQRVREVGLRKAVGAKNGHIISQFLIEAVFITFIGGILGIIFGIFVSFLAALIIRSLGYEWEFIVTLSSMLLATSVSVAIGLIFGIYPARKASQISPMEALRYE
ncbi:MAG: ABC transporter permease [Candidatus Moranbacteria bacterium]|nr:ABC transporter permease [Candidatus Moranbacteria bacterium]